MKTLCKLANIKLNHTYYIKLKRSGELGDNYLQVEATPLTLHMIIDLMLMQIY